MTRRDDLVWTDRIKEVCAEACAYPYGEPPCWRLPELTNDCESVEPCADCLALIAQEDAAQDRGMEG
ncbi:MAG: hypothetical protein R3197_00250 [Paracoccaceae bacterium]|nr:hypothetical protein [Paracoccaceae bacterium]